jgi:hypothetical protein
MTHNREELNRKKWKMAQRPGNTKRRSIISNDLGIF